MALTYSEPRPLGWKAEDFDLPAILPAGGTHRQAYRDRISLKSLRDKKILVAVFMCNHCPYVIAVQDRLIEIAKKVEEKGGILIGINSNDAVRYPDDGFEAMLKRSEEKKYPFPYVFDEDQAVAHAYGAVCTPDPYVFENVGGAFQLRYHGRIDDSWKDPAHVKQTDLWNAVEQITRGEKPDTNQKPSMGCSIKWKP